jgi:NAD(P)-dependent dehydrogenase (short-subunit alcohol dehydrogenase family)
MSKGITPVDPNSFFANRFKNQVLFVTGAAHSSIGGATAIRAAREGAKVFCVDIKADKLNQTVQEIKAQGGQAIALVTDLCEAKAADHAVAECVAQFGGLNLVLNAAGVMDGNDPSRPPDFENTTHLLPAAIHTATELKYQRDFLFDARAASATGCTGKGGRNREHWFDSRNHWVARQPCLLRK